MVAKMVSESQDPIRPDAAETLTIRVDGEAVTGIVGQSIAGLLLAADRLELRRTAEGDKPRGVFCGIGVCFDCLVEVNGLSDVRACQRRAHDGDVVATRIGSSPPGDSSKGTNSSAKGRAR